MLWGVLKCFKGLLNRRNPRWERDEERVKKKAWSSSLSMFTSLSTILPAEREELHNSHPANMKIEKDKAFRLAYWPKGRLIGLCHFAVWQLSTLFLVSLYTNESNVITYVIDTHKPREFLIFLIYFYILDLVLCSCSLKIQDSIEDLQEFF